MKTRKTEEEDNVPFRFNSPYEFFFYSFDLNQMYDI